MIVTIFQATMIEWRTVFWISFGLHMAKIANFMLFGSAEVQPWDTPKRVQNDSEANEKQRVDPPTAIS